ncbi:asparagine synthetase B family protein [Lentzea pudingi]|uniref:asparagine synthetase B family protein n=1 Tax=Lentzea pudingi TaxID=1789439 RepID=UPI0016698400|nr:asparagine synthase-related protein [Lentzea pudingi]
MLPPTSGVPLVRTSASAASWTLSVDGVGGRAEDLAQHLWHHPDGAFGYAGIIYNWPELTRRLRAVVDARTEITSCAHAIALLLRHDPQWTLANVNGKFAAVDVTAHTITCWRDKIGEEQLYHGGGPRRFVAASTVLSVAESLGTARIVVPDSFRVFETPVGAETMLEGVSKLPPGSVLTRDAAEGRVTTRTYWQVEPGETTESDEDVVAGFRDLLFDAITLRMDGGANSCFLSGGQDSSFVAGALARLGSPPRFAFTTAFAELDHVYNEAPYAALAAKHSGAEHVVLEPNASDFATHYPKTIEVLGEVKANAAHFIEYWIARAAAERGITRLFSGYGADESLGGEVRYLVGYLDRDRATAMRLAQEHPLLRDYRPLFEKIATVPQDADEALKYFTLMKRGDASGGDGPHLALVRSLFAAAGDRLVDQMGIVDTAISGQPLLDTARVDKYWGVDKICPFLDHRVITAAYALPERLKIRDLTTKVALRLASAGIVPDEITHRPTKVGFAFPHNHGPYQRFLSDLADRFAVRTGRPVRVDPSRGRYDRTLLMAASEEILRRRVEDVPVGVRTGEGG